MYFNDWVDGELAEAADFNGLNEGVFALSAYFVPVIFGFTNFNGAGGFALRPTLVSPMTVSIGGTGQLACIDAKIVNEMPQTNLTFNFNDDPSEPRFDYILATYVENQVNPFTRLVRAEDGTTTETTCYQIQQSVTFSIAQGSSNTYPEVPAGAVVIALVTVPPQGAQIMQNDIVMDIPSFESVIAGLAVSTLNNLIGPVTLISSNGSIVVDPNPGNGTIDLRAAAAAASVTSLLGGQGVLTLVSDGSLAIGRSGQTIQITNNGVRSISSPDNSIAIGSAGAGQVTLKGPQGWNGSGASSSAWGKESNVQILVGDAETNSESLYTVYPPPGFTIYGGVATFRDASFSAAVEMAVDYTDTPDGGITFSARYSFTNPPTPTGAGLGFNFICVARPN